MGTVAFSSDTAWAREAYRPDVDGLRAPAALAIFAFHLGLAGSRGGFVGVDVFFVISGFVITRGVLLEIDEQRFSLQAFNLRCARRILPALIETAGDAARRLDHPFAIRDAGVCRQCLGELGIGGQRPFSRPHQLLLPMPPTTDRSSTPVAQLGRVPADLGRARRARWRRSGAHPGLSCGPVAGLVRGGGLVPHTPCPSTCRWRASGSSVREP